METVKLGNVYESPKHGPGQVVDVRSGRDGSPLWIIMYQDGTFGSYYNYRIYREFKLVGTQPLPEGFPKIAARLPNNSSMPTEKAIAYVNGGNTVEFEERVATLQSRGFSRAQAIARVRVDNRPYHVIFVDFLTRSVTKREVKK